MQIILLTHPEFLTSQSMPLFADMIKTGMEERGYKVDRWFPKPFFFRLPVPRSFKKWLGYLDQFLLFPILVKWRIRTISADTLFVFTDQALGPWVPLVKDRPHVIHCHDFMALHSSMGYYPQNHVYFTGRQYQAFIKRGFSMGKNFISVSEKTHNDLSFILNKPANLNDVVYNGLNYPFRPLMEVDSKRLLGRLDKDIPTRGFLLHVGGNQWYKNRTGVLQIYNAYCRQQSHPLPLLMIGREPTDRLLELSYRCINSGGFVKFFTDVSTETIQAAYSLARVLIFPSISEGFGWPIAEAMACGCLVLTTGEAPMTEVGGEAAFYLTRIPLDNIDEWANNSAEELTRILLLSPSEKKLRQDLGFKQVEKFDSARALSAYESIYRRIAGRV